MHSLGLWLLAALWLRVTLGEQFQVVWPQRLPAPRTRRALHSHTDRYPESVSYVLGSGRHNFTLHLRKNRDLVGSGYRETYTSANGSEVTEPLQGQDHCFYQGHVQGHQHSAASLSTCTGLRGFFQAGPALHLIEPLNAAGEAGPHKLYQLEHLHQGPGTCGVSDNSLASILGPRTSAAFRSKNWPSPRDTRFVELYVVTDYREFQLLGSREAVRRHVLEVVNHVDKLYQDLNFRVALVGLEMWNGGDKIHISPYANRTLEAFLTWRARDLASRQPHDNAQLITAVDFIGITVGLARVSSMCSQDSGAVNQDHAWQNPVGVASTMAHEMGHNLGLNHDENVQGCYCPVPRASGGCVMAGTISSQFPTMFSYCSQVDLETFVEGSHAACLRNAPDPDRLVGGPVCGNGFLERGEQCDCGNPQDCRNHCCNATTCQLAEGAQCAQGSCCKDCKVMPAGQVCRPQRNGCDLEERCDGQQPGCPEDTFQENGTPCPGGYCYDGTCPTPAGRCRDLWGPGARVAVDECSLYSISTSCRGGLPQWPGRAEKCGVLFCEGGRKPLERTSCTLTIRMGVCQALSLDDGTAFEPVPEGTKCGHEQVCWKGRCQDFHVYRSRNCSAQCSGHGVCDHKQECHCLPGWVPPYCTQRLVNIRAGRPHPTGQPGPTAPPPGRCYCGPHALVPMAPGDPFGGREGNCSSRTAWHPIPQLHLHLGGTRATLPAGAEGGSLGGPGLWGNLSARTSIEAQTYSCPDPALCSAPRSFLVGTLLLAATLLLLLAVGVVLYRRARGPGQKRGLLGLSNPLFHQRSPPAAPTLGSPLPAVAPKRPPPVPPAALSSPPFPLPVYTLQTPQQQAPAPPSKPFPQLKPRQGAAGQKAAPKPPASRR